VLRITGERSQRGDSVRLWQTRLRDENPVPRYGPDIIVDLSGVSAIEAAGIGRPGMASSGWREPDSSYTGN
jgi:hypothetical protein